AQLLRDRAAELALQRPRGRADRESGRDREAERQHPSQAQPLAAEQDGTPHGGLERVDPDWVRHARSPSGPLVATHSRPSRTARVAVAGPALVATPND